MIAMPRPRAKLPPPPWHDPFRGCWITRWRSHGPPAKRHTKRFFVGSETQAQKEYKHWLAQWQADPRLQNPSRPEGLTVAQLAALHNTWAEKTFTKDGEPTTHVGKIAKALELFCELYGGRPAELIKAPDVAAWRHWVIGGTDKDPGRNRETVNALLACVKVMYKWAAESGLVPVPAKLEVESVGRLKKGRSRAKEPGKTDSVALKIVEATVAHLQPQLAKMVWLGWNSGLRPSEICSVKAFQIDRTGACWFYRPRHKLEHKEGIERVVPLGPRAQAILRPLLSRLGYLFKPSQAENATENVGKRYTAASFRRAIQRAAEKAGVVSWSPNMLRHSYATRVKQALGKEAGRMALGHARGSNVTEDYFDQDLAGAADIALKMG